MSRVAALMSSLLLSGCFVGHLYTTDWPEPGETHQVRTSDGWVLDLRHLKPEGAARQARPVVVMHGIVTNGRNCDLDAEHSLARELARRGFDVWVPSLRGTGGSEKRSLLTVEDTDTNFDAFVTRDLPAIIEYVKQQTGSAKVDYVGHSMGGMVLYAYLARGARDIGRAVTLGSPVRVRWTGIMEDFVRQWSWVSPMSKLAPIRTVAMSTLPLQGTIDGPLERLLISRENVTIDTWQKFIAVGVDDISSGLSGQFAGWLARDQFDSADHSTDYLAALRNVTTPVLVMAGKIDGIAPPWTVRPAFDALGSPEKRWLVLGEANGQSADYNHMDMLLGEHIGRDLVPLVAGWLVGR